MGGDDGVRRMPEPLFLARAHLKCFLFGSAIARKLSVTLFVKSRSHLVINSILAAPRVLGRRFGELFPARRSNKLLLRCLCFLVALVQDRFHDRFYFGVKTAGDRILVFATLRPLVRHS